jgi:hypothetical protein
MPDWTGETVCIIASGNSLTQEDIAHAAQYKTIVVNDCYKLAPWANVLYACDTKWWRSQVVSFNGEKWTQCKESAIRFNLNHIEGKHEKGLGKDLIHFGGASGYQAINLAYLWGAKKLLLLGFDCKKVDNKAHWFGQHPKGLARNQPFAVWIENFKQLAIDLEQAGVEVINCSPDSALDCFKKKRINENI